MDRAFSQRQEFSRDDPVYHMSSQSAHGLGFGDDDDILVKLELNDAQDTGDARDSLGAQKLTVVEPDVP